MPESIESEAEIILHALASTPFQDCIALSKEFRALADDCWHLRRLSTVLLEFSILVKPEHCAIAFVVGTKLYYGHS